MPRPRSTLECCWRAAATLPAQRRHIAVPRRRGDPNGGFNLGVLLDEHGDVNGAVRAYRFADQRGHAAAACNLGAILAEHGDASGAEEAFNRANQRGDSNAVFNLATLLSTLEHPEPARDGSLNEGPPLEGRDFAGVSGPAVFPVAETPARGARLGRRYSHARATRRAAKERPQASVHRPPFGAGPRTRLLVVAAAVVVGSSLTRAPKNAVNSAANARPTRPASTVGTIASSRLPAVRAPGTLAPRPGPHTTPNVKTAARTKRPSSASTRSHRMAEPRCRAEPRSPIRSTDVCRQPARRQRDHRLGVRGR